jgi:serine/threonine protein kinase
MDRAAALDDASALADIAFVSCQTPRTIGKYPVERKLGTGATSTVYLAKDPFLQRDVAIKVAMPQVLQDPVHGQHYRKLFVNEASLAGRLKHPHMAAIYDAAVDDDCHYIVMEYVPGGTLEQHCHAAHLPSFSETAEIVFKCCRALDYADRQGVIHRDIKPANIMLGKSTDVKITDFGTALSMRPAQMQVRGVLGSPAYMSPERIADRPLTYQTDIYSLGVVMYQLLTGHLPFSAENQTSLPHKIVNDTPPPVRRIRPEIPAVLEEVVKRAVKKEMGGRYQNWNEFSLDLAHAFTQIEQPVDKIADTKKFEALRALSFFTEFSDAELWELLQISSWRRFPPERLLITEGNMGHSLYILAAGKARVTRGDRVLSTLRAGECFGEMAFIKRVRVPRVASVISTTDVTLVKIKAKLFAGASQNLQLRFNQRFLDVLVDRLARTTDMVAE